MKKKFPHIVLALIILTLAACGSAEPTMNAGDIANTAIADAWIAITQTQAAMPTATVIPPTSTPEATATLAPTLVPIPTLVPATLAVAGVPTTDPCNQVPPAEPQGALVNVEFTNKGGGSANFAFGMNSPNDKSECVTYSFVLGDNSLTPAKVLLGCYWGYAWLTGSETSVARTGGTLLCLTDPNATYHVLVTKETIVLK